MWLNSLRSTNEVSWSHAEQLITNQLINIYADVAQLAEQLICNQQVIGSSPIIGLTLLKRNFNIAGWSSLEARRAHNPKVAGSNPAPAILPR